MLLVLRYVLLLSGTAMLTWSVATYNSNVTHSSKVEQRFNEFMSKHSKTASMQHESFFKDYQMLKVRCMITGGMYHGTDRTIPMGLFGGVFLLGGFLSFLVKSKESEAEQAAPSNR